MQNKLLIVGAGPLQIPMIKKAKELDLYVGVVDYNPQAPGIEYADEYFNCSTIDRDGLLEVAKTFEPKGICTMATDMPMRAISYVCEKLGLPSISCKTAIQATDKYEMIKVFEKYEVAHPRYFEIETFEDLQKKMQFMELPVLLKPVDSSGSRGVVKVESVEQLESAYHYAKSSSKNGNILIEEFMVGPEVSVECFSQNGIVHVLQITDKLTTGAPYFVELGHVQPSQLDVQQKKNISSLAVQAVQALGIQNGPAHVEIIYTKSGPKMVELGARMGGDCITSHLVPLSTGIDMMRATIEYALGYDKIDLNSKWEKSAVIRYFNFVPGKIKNIEIPKDFVLSDTVKEINFNLKKGDIIPEITSSLSRVGYIICQNDDVNQAIAECEDLCKKIKIVYEKE